MEATGTAVDNVQQSLADAGAISQDYLSSFSYTAEMPSVSKLDADYFTVQDSWRDGERLWLRQPELPHAAVAATGCLCTGRA